MSGTLRGAARAGDCGIHREPLATTGFSWGDRGRGYLVIQCNLPASNLFETHGDAWPEIATGTWIFEDVWEHWWRLLACLSDLLPVCLPARLAGSLSLCLSVWVSVCSSVCMAGWLALLCVYEPIYSCYGRFTEACGVLLYYSRVYVELRGKRHDVVYKTSFFSYVPHESVKISSQHMFFL